MEIIPFTSDDQNAAVSFIRSIFQEMGWPEIPEYGIDNLTAFFHLPDHGFLFLLRQDSLIIGVGGGVLLQANTCLLKRFYLAKEHRGTSAAKQLLDKIISHAKSLHLSRIVIDVSKKNTRAIRFYEKNGFTQYNQTPTDKWHESLQPDKFNNYFLTLLQNVFTSFLTDYTQVILNR